MLSTKNSYIEEPLPPAKKKVLGASLMFAFFANTCSFVSLATYSVFDPHFSNSKKSFTIDASEYQNWLGALGSYSADVALNFFGHGAYALPILFYFFIYKKVRTSGLYFLWDSYEHRNRVRNNGLVEKYNYKYGFFGATGVLLLASVADTVLFYDEKVGFDKLLYAKYDIPYQFGGAIGFEISNALNLHNSWFLASLFFSVGLWTSIQFLLNVNFIDLITNKLDEKHKMQEIEYQQSHQQNNMTNHFNENNSQFDDVVEIVMPQHTVNNDEHTEEDDWGSFSTQTTPTVPASAPVQHSHHESDDVVMPKPKNTRKKKAAYKLPNPADFLHLDTTNLSKAELDELTQKRNHWASNVLAQLESNLHKRFNQEKKNGEISDKADHEEMVFVSHPSFMMNQVIFHIKAGEKVNTKNFLSDDNTSSIARAIGDTISLYTQSSEEVESIQDKIRIQVKGTGFIVIVPLPYTLRRKYSLISMLADCIKTDTDMDKMTLNLGYNGSNDAIVRSNVLKMPHGLVAGSTGSGKSVFLMTFLIGLMFANSPKDLRFIILDPKKVDYFYFEKSPHLLFPIVNDDVNIRKRNPNEMYMGIKVLQWVVALMEHRYKILHDIGIQDWKKMNEKIIKGQTFSTKYNPDFSETFETENDNQSSEYIINNKQPYIIFIADEYTSILNVLANGDSKNKTHDADAFQDAIEHLAIKARGAGIHLILSMQRPDSKVLNGQIKDNIKGRFGFAIEGSKTQSNIILPSETYDLSKLQGSGDAVFAVVDDNGRVSEVPLQSPFISEDEIEAVVEWWTEQAPQELLDLELLKSDTSEYDEDDFNEDNPARRDFKNEILELAKNQSVSGVSISQVQKIKGLGNFDAAKEMLKSMVDDGLLVYEDKRYYLS